MKFMKLGSKPDAFQFDGSTIRYVSSDLATDVAVTVGDVKFYLHKFPLLSKSSRLQKLIVRADEEESDEIHLPDFPGGPKAFDICAKFCYGMTVTLNAYNVVAARCAAEYLEMTEDVDRGNLIYKIEVFLNSSIFRTWKDSIIVLQNSKSLLPWSEDLKIIGRCIDSIASKTSVDPSKITWSYTHNRKLAMQDRIIEHETVESVPKDWWVEDLCELDINLYKRVLIAIKSKGRMDGSVIGEALKMYAIRWLPDSLDALVSDDHIQRNKSLVETIICLLPPDRSLGCSCSFLFKLLKVAVLVEAEDAAREDLVRKISLKLDQATVKDLLIPARPPQPTVYDVELVLCILKRFVLQEKSCWELNIYENNEKGESELALDRGSLLNVGGLVDAYLAEIASDLCLAPSSFIELARLIPESARPIHDGLYRAIDMYLKEHPDLTKAEKKQICGLMDVKKFTMDASTHAAQNDRLPLRVVVQVLYFEQMRSASTTQSLNRTSNITSSSTPNEDEDWDQRTLESCKSLRKQIDKVKIEDNEELQRNGKMMAKKNSSKNSRSGAQLVPSRSRRIFDKLWGMGKGNGESKSSETSGSSQSPTTSLVPGDTKSSGSSSRHRRHSVS
ncbi:BTB/POZ domain-containing protein NPY1-like [Chenopodium quinoa]|uniref:BTB/POZ domain-containing protein NPY1-like n=1 Tax=Chenopodium quinoa TaxID=63459 RepID=UPI000B7913BA|nr:BTB/POZ domain-containing protein NPY1-like [Chenopodium quinoa]